MHSTRKTISASVADAWERMEYRPVAVAVIRDGSGNVLLTKPVKDPDAWVFPQGGIDPEEQAEYGLIRELGEELSMDPEQLAVGDLLAIVDQDAEAGRKDKRGFKKGKRYFAFAVSYKGDPDLELNPDEILDYQWADPEAARRIIATSRPDKADFLRSLI